MDGRTDIQFQIGNNKNNNNNDNRAKIIKYNKQNDMKSNVQMKRLNSDKHLDEDTGKQMDRQENKKKNCVTNDRSKKNQQKIQIIKKKLARRTLIIV